MSRPCSSLGQKEKSEEYLLDKEMIKGEASTSIYAD